MKNEYTILLGQQKDGRWYATAKDTDDGNGNDLDCIRETFLEALIFIGDLIKNETLPPPTSPSR